MEAAQELKLFSEFEKSSKWLAENFEDIRKKHEGKFVAVKGGRILAYADSLPELKEKLKGIDLAVVLVDYIPPKDLVILL